MKAREIIAAELFWPFEIVYGDPSEAANDYAARIVSQLAKAGFVILPKEPSEGMIEAACRARCKFDRTAPDADWRDCGAVMLSVALPPGQEQRWRTHAHVVADEYRAMIKVAEE